MHKNNLSPQKKRQVNKQHKNANDKSSMSKKRKINRTSQVYENDYVRGYDNNVGYNDERYGNKQKVNDNTNRRKTHRNKGKKQERRLTKAALRRRKMQRRIWTFFLVLIALIIGIVLSVVLLFKVTTIELQSPSGEIADTGVYTEELVLAKLGIELEENIFGFNEKEKEEALSAALPLLEQVDIVRKFPSTVYVRLAPAKESYAIKAGENWLVLSSELRVITMVSETPSLPVLMGATPASWTTGEKLSFAEDAQDEAERQLAIEEGQISADEQVLPTRKETLDLLFLELTERDLLKDTTDLVFAGEMGIWFLYQDRIAVEVGTIHELDYKLDLAKYILLNENGDGCSSTDTGVLNVSNQNIETDVSAIFKQGVAQMPTAEEITPSTAPTQPQDPEQAQATTQPQTTEQPQATATTEPTPSDDAASIT